jgi:hypothetical protein
LLEPRLAVLGNCALPRARSPHTRVRPPNRTRRPWHNIASVGVMGCVCFLPRFSLFVFLLWRSAVALRRLLMHVSVCACVCVCGHVVVGLCCCSTV